MIEAADETRCSNLQSGDDVLQPADYLGKPVLRRQGLRHPCPRIYPEALPYSRVLSEWSVAKARLSKYPKLAGEDRLSDPRLDRVSDIASEARRGSRKA